MRIVRFGINHAIIQGLLQDDHILPLKTDLARGTLDPGEQMTFLSKNVKMLAPVDPPNILAIGLNYRKHADELGSAYPKAPIVFSKTTNTVIGDGQDILLLAMAPDEVDYEGELAIVTKGWAKNVSRERAFDYVPGYTCANDVSARDGQMRQGRQWTRGKSFDTFCPLGPWIQTEVDPDRLELITWVNDDEVQRSNTHDLIFDCRTLVSYLSHCMTLLPGTVILTGTPSGVGYNRNPRRFLNPGDLVEVEIEKIGTLKNTVSREPSTSERRDE